LLKFGDIIAHPSNLALEVSLHLFELFLTDSQLDLQLPLLLAHLVFLSLVLLSNLLDEGLIVPSQGRFIMFVLFLKDFYHVCMLYTHTFHQFLIVSGSAGLTLDGIICCFLQ
jgi:hypothetical protein